MCTIGFTGYQESKREGDHLEHGIRCLDILDRRRLRLYQRMVELLSKGYCIVETRSKGHREYVTVEKHTSCRRIVEIAPFEKEVHVKVYSGNEMRSVREWLEG